MMPTSVHSSAPGTAPTHFNSVKKVESTVQDYITLTKPGVILLVVFTALIALILPSESIHPFIGFIVLLAITISAAGAAAFNMWYDRDIDSIMNRTQNRPIPLGKIQPPDALAFSIILCGTGLMLMYFAVPQVAFYLFFSILFYTLIYTVILKRSTDQNIVIGGAAGAFPPLIAWVAVTHHLSIEPLILFFIIFIWTPSHFWALAIFRSEDYKAAKIPMLPLTRGITATTKSILCYSIILVVSSYLPLFFNLGHQLYGISITVINLPYLFYAWKLNQTPSPHLAMRLFSYSIFYLFGLYLLLLIDKLYYQL